MHRLCWLMINWTIRNIKNIVIYQEKLNLKVLCLQCLLFCSHSDVIMNKIASQITSVSIVYSTVCSGVNQRKTSKLRVTGLCVGYSPATGEFPAQRASNAENVYIWCRHHGVKQSGHLTPREQWQLPPAKRLGNFNHLPWQYLLSFNQFCFVFHKSKQ